MDRKEQLMKIFSVHIREILTALPVHIGRLQEIRLRAGRPLRAVLDMRLLRLRARCVLLLYRARAGSARLSLLLLRTAAGGLRRTLRAGWLSFVTKQLIKVLKMIGHGLISLSTWNASLRPLGAGTPFPLGA